MSTQVRAKILDGKQCAQAKLDELALQLQALKDRGNPLPKLVVVLVGEDPASQVYVKKKAQTAQKIGMLSELIVLPASTSEAELLQKLDQLNQDASVHGILVQLPLPKHINTQRIINAVLPEKDVDGLHPLNLGKLLTGDSSACVSCTPGGIMTLLAHYQIEIAGKHVVVVGRSNIVGKPISLLMLAQNATVTICHSKTQNLPAVCSQADILVAAVGIPKLITADFVKPGAVVVDVGINRLDGKLVGDVDFDAVQEKASWITPVPGGVGPMTIATLMGNTLFQYENQKQAH